MWQAGTPPGKNGASGWALAADAADAGGRRRDAQAAGAAAGVQADKKEREKRPSPRGGCS